MEDILFQLDEERLLQIPLETEAEGADRSVAEPFAAYFGDMALLLEKMIDYCRQMQKGADQTKSMEELLAMNHALFEDLRPNAYKRSWANAVYCSRQFGSTEYGQIMAALSAEVRSLLPYLADGESDRARIRLDLFLEVYTAFTTQMEESLKGAGSSIPPVRFIRDKIYSYLTDYAEDEMLWQTRQFLCCADNQAAAISAQADLDDLRYLFRYGEYISENEIKTAAYLRQLPEEKIAAMADTFTEGYRRGFAAGNKNFDAKKTVAIYTHLGFERMMRRAQINFEDMGKEVIFPREIDSMFFLPASNRTQQAGGEVNAQYRYEHREDLALFLDDTLMNRRTEAMRNAYNELHAQTVLYAGPAVLEPFGGSTFTPTAVSERAQYSKAQQNLITHYKARQLAYYNEAVIGRDRSFTIISFPLPDIGLPQGGERYEQIFDAVLQINTLDNQKWLKIQDTLIDELNRADRLHVLGRNSNRTDLTVNLYKLTDPAHQTIFENCVADVNIPVGEVFTTPVLKGTDGILHVQKVFLEGLLFQNLMLTFHDGLVETYECGGFDTPEQGRRYVEENILFHHKTLPMGECAIGTNTTAYALGRELQIEQLYPILIAEKTGPHFAVGDTCYSNEEDNHVYNPDGKEIVAKENDFSLLRRSDPDRAYFGCHTDITIPYSELGLIETIHADGSRTALIRDGRFVLPGTEELNVPLDRIQPDGQ